MNRYRLGEIFHSLLGLLGKTNVSRADSPKSWLLYNERTKTGLGPIPTERVGSCFAHDPDENLQHWVVRDSKPEGTPLTEVPELLRVIRKAQEAYRAKVKIRSHSPEGQAKTLNEEYWAKGAKNKAPLEEALRILEAALATRPSDTVLLTCYGSILADLGKFKLARQALQKSADLGSTDANTFFNLGATMPAWTGTETTSRARCTNRAR